LIKCLVYYPKKIRWKQKLQSVEQNKPVEREEQAEKLSSLESLRPLLSPRMVAIIGASRYPGTIGYLLLQCMVEAGFTGTVYPVNPNADSVMSIKAYPSVLDIPGEVEMAVIAVPAKLVSKVASECGRKGVRALIVISDGFKEVGPEGALREEELRNIIQRYGMRVVGPNCMGIINTADSIKMNATFSSVFPPAGNVAFMSQSGAMGLTILEHANNLNMGISTFVSAGNRIDVESNELLEYWENDPETKVILLYLESFGDPRRFARVARRISAKKPIVVVKSGNTPAGSRAAASHTGAMATSDVTIDALFQHAGIIRVNSMEELFDVATLLSNQPLPSGRRLAIITNGGGPGIIAADASARSRLVLPQFSPDTEDKLKSVALRDIVINNPLDTTAGSTPEEFCHMLEILANDNGNDAVLAIFVPPVATELAAMENAIRNVAPIYWRRRKPLLACFLGERGFKAKLGSKGRFVPSYPFPEEAISSLVRAIEYVETRKKPKGKIPRFHGLKRKRAHEVVELALARSDRKPVWLTANEAYDLLGCYGIRFVNMAVARTADEAAVLASKLGFPVVVKLDSSSLVHKTDVGGVVLGLNSDTEVRQAVNDIGARLAKLGRESEIQGMIVQEMVKGGIETIAGVTQDPSFGPLIMFGSGGVYAELVKDVTLRLHPLTDLDAKAMVVSIKMAKLFEGFRGAPPSDIKSVEDLLLRLSAMVEDLPQIGELDLNPVFVMPVGEGYRVVDAKIMVK
jgi:acetyl coenzyme A synthetase (ADP forming)-like protein